MIEKGSRLGRYTILARIGAGGMGQVWRACDECLQREAAIKVLPGGLAGDPGRLRRLENEARALAGLSHPSNLQVHEPGQRWRRTFVVTELPEGETLRERLGRGPLVWRHGVETGAGVAGGVGHGPFLPTEIGFEPQWDDPAFQRLIRPRD